jgi:hypothetical protein
MKASIVTMALLSALTASPVWSGAVPGDLLGVRIGMTFEESARELEKSGELTRQRGGAAGTKQFWTLTHPRYAHAAVRFNRERRVEWITLFARPDGPPVRYSDIADLDQARIQGKYFYSWIELAKGGRPARAVRASGDDPERLHSVSLYRPSSLLQIADSGGKEEESK